jgi:hypothetical protein
MAERITIRVQVAEDGSLSFDSDGEWGSIHRECDSQEDLAAAIIAEVQDRLSPVQGVQGGEGEGA